MKKHKAKTKKKKTPKKKAAVQKKAQAAKSEEAKPPKPSGQKPERSIAKRPPETKKAGEHSPLRYITQAGQFLRESRMELKKVKWPTRKELLASTAVVIVLTLFVAFYLGLVDFGLIKIIKRLVG